MKWLLLSLVLAGCRAPPRPEVVVWAWDRAEQLDFLRGCDVGVAYMVSAVILRGDEVRVQPRKGR